MTTEHEMIKELLGVYAVDAVDDDERRLVDDHLDECAECRAEVRSHLEVTAMLAGSAAPPSEVWDLIESELGSESTAEGPAPFPLRLPDDARSAAASGPEPGHGAGGDVVSMADRRPRATRWLAGAVAAAAAVASLLAVNVIRQEDRIDELQAALNVSTTERAAQLALADSRAERATLRSADGSVEVLAVIDSSGTGFVFADGLPALPADRSYQLWGVSGDRVISLGVLGSDPRVVVFPAGAPLNGLAITDEVSGGVVASEQQPVVSGVI